MEHQKIFNSLNEESDSKFVTRIMMQEMKLSIIHTC